MNRMGGPADATSQLDALYAEVDLTKKRQQRCASSGSAGYTPSPVPSSSNGGLGLSGPINSLMLQRFPDSTNRLSLSGLTRTARDSRVDSGSVDMETPISLSPKSPMVDHHLSSSHEEQTNSAASGLKKPIPPPRTRIPRKDSGDNSHGVNGSGGSAATVSDHSAASSSGGQKGKCPSLSTLSGLSDAETFENGDGPTTALGELGQAIDQAIASMTAAASEHSDYDVPKPPRSLKMRPRLVSNEVHDYAEIYTPSKERLPWNSASSSSLPTNAAAVATGPAGAARHSSSHPGSLAGSDHDHYQDDGKPPTPPLHRFPSWESRIYQAAADGFSLSDQPPTVAPHQPAQRNNSHLGQPQHSQQQQPRPHTQRLSASGSVGYQDISIPVYATVKGVSGTGAREKFPHPKRSFVSSAPAKFDQCPSAGIRRIPRTGKITSRRGVSESWKGHID